MGEHSSVEMFQSDLKHFTEFHTQLGSLPHQMNQ